MGRLIAAAGIALALFGRAYAFGCDFDTMDVCRPFGLFTAGAFEVSGSGGLCVVSGAVLALVGMGIALVRKSMRKAS